ncbi:MAG TPA: hypothetical protein ENN73_04475 [Firmicutes bacterium]|nr:hypothetical protein [Bacillota bacterium]
MLRKEQKSKEQMKLLLEEQKLREQKEHERFEAENKAKEEKRLSEKKKQEELFKKIEEDKKKVTESPASPDSVSEPVPPAKERDAGEKPVVSIEKSSSGSDNVSVSFRMDKRLLIIIPSAIIVIVLFFSIVIFSSKGKDRKMDKQLKEQIALYVSDLSTKKYKGEEFDSVRLSLADLYYKDKRYDDYIKTLREIYDDEKAAATYRKEAYDKLKTYLDKTDPELIEIWKEINNPESGTERIKMARDKLLSRYNDLSLYEDAIILLREKIENPKASYDERLKYSQTLANLYKKRNHLKDGVKVMQDFLDSTPPGNNEIRRLARLSLGDYYRGIGQYNNAKREYEILVKYYYPDYAEGKLAYKALHEMRKEGKIK